MSRSCWRPLLGRDKYRIRRAENYGMHALHCTKDRSRRLLEIQWSTTRILLSSKHILERSTYYALYYSRYSQRLRKPKTSRHSKPSKKRYVRQYKDNKIRSLPKLIGPLRPMYPIFTFSPSLQLDLPRRILLYHLREPIGLSTRNRHPACSLFPFESRGKRSV